MQFSVLHPVISAPIGRWVDDESGARQVASGDAILVRDTTDRRGPVLAIAADAWRTFLASMRQG